jgi:hypothetical protein
VISALDRGEWSVSCPGRFPPGERAPGTHWLEGWMGPIAGVDAVESNPGERAPGAHWIGGRMGPRAGLDALNLTRVVQFVVRCYTN